MLIAQVRDEREKLRKFREIIFAENEKQFYRQRLVAEKIAEEFQERVLRFRGLGKFLAVLRGFLEKRHEFLELIEDQQRRAALVFHPEARVHIRGGKDEPRPRFIVYCETRRQKWRAAFISERNPFDDQFRARHRLDAQTFRQKTFVEHRGDESGVDHGRFPHPRFAVEQRAAINRDEADELSGLVTALEKDRAIDETELLDAAI